MIAQLLEVNTAATKERQGKTPLTGISFKYQPQPFKGQTKPPVDRFVFKNSPVAPALMNGDVKPGDWIEIKFDQSQFKNPESITKTSAPSPQQAQPAPQPKRSYGQQDEQTQLRIVRSVAFKGATELISAGFGEAKKTSKNEVLAEEVIALSKKFEAYLNMQEVESSIESSVGDVKGTEDYDQEDFDS